MSTKLDELPAPLLSEVCRRYNLGKVVVPPVRVFGGLLHWMYHLQTSQGTFALKLLNPTIMGYANVRDNFRRSERIAAAIQSSGIPAITALLAATDGDVLHDIGDNTVLLYPWINGSANTVPVAAGAERAHKIGSILGRTHALSLSFPGIEPPTLSEEGGDESPEWETLIQQAEHRALPFAVTARTLLPAIGE